MIKTFRIKSHKVTVEFYQRYECLILESWHTEEPIPCRVEADFIESQIKLALNTEFDTNYDFYVQEYIDYLADGKYDRDKVGI